MGGSVNDQLRMSWPRTGSPSHPAFNSMTTPAPRGNPAAGGCLVVLLLLFLFRSPPSLLGRPFHHPQQGADDDYGNYGQAGRAITNADDGPALEPVSRPRTAAEIAILKETIKSRDMVITRMDAVMAKMSTQIETLQSTVTALSTQTTGSTVK